MGVTMSNRIDQAFQFQQTALRLRDAREELLSSNIANADTPNYQARDFNFANALKTALGNQVVPPVQMATTQPGHITPQAPGGMAGIPVQYRSVIQPSADGNTVDMNQEQAQFQENTVRYESSLQFVSQQIKDVITALTG